MSNKDIAQMQTQRLLVLGAISELPAEDQAKFRAACAAVKDTAKAHGEFGIMAVAMALMDLSIAAEEE